MGELAGQDDEQDDHDHRKADQSDEHVDYFQ